MTLIELFDGTPIENFISTLALKPKETVFVTTDAKKARRACTRYRRILSGRGIECELSVVSCPKNDLGGIYSTLASLLRGDGSYVIDISGGDGGALFASGMLLSRCEGKKLFAFRINPTSRRGVLFGLSGGEITRNVYDFSCGTDVYLTCEENIILHGGEVISRGEKFSDGDELCTDIETLWGLCRVDPAGWNAKINRLSNELGRLYDTGLRVLPCSSLGYGKKSVDARLWKRLEDGGFVLTERTGDNIYLTFKNRVVEQCLTKAGSLLEYRVYLAGIRAMRDEEKAFDSAEVGITIGWDGGVENEIDCMLMSGVCPLFISCKNGEIRQDELYKLGTVSERFGSDYGRAVLLSTVFFDKSTSSTQSLRHRATDMDIRMISRVHTLSSPALDTAIASLAP